MNTISGDLHSWLTHYLQRKDCLHKSLMISLQKKLDTIHSLDELDSLVTSIKIPTSRRAFFGQETPDPFATKLNAINQTIQQIKSLHSKQIYMQFTRLSATNKTRCLLNLLEHILTQPSVLMHVLTLNLLRQLSDLSQLQRIINHLEEQPSIPCPIHPAPGSFDSVKSLSKEHKECLDLLRSNSATYNDGLPHSTAANILLQTALKIYQDSNTILTLDMVNQEFSPRHAVPTM